MKLTAWLRHKLGGKKPDQLLAAPPSPSEPQPTHLADADEVYLQALIADVAAGRRRDQLNGNEVIEHIDALWARGHERLAIEWIEKLLSVPEVDPALTMRLRASVVERYDQRRDIELGLAHAEVLLGDPKYALRAHVLLAEYALHRGDNAAALRHYEAVLVRDVRYPNALMRVERLRAAVGRHAPAPGETIAGGDLRAVDSGGRYRLLRELGRGATGAVYVARDTELERDVAVKLLHPHLASDGKAAALATFFREARITASLRHPNIVAVLDLDERARRIVMELAAGGTLRELLRERGRRSPRRAIERHVQILSALAAAHRNGIVHRDLKPANLMFRRDPDWPGVEVVLGDFGVAHLPDQARANAEQPRAADAVGTLAYMAPEQRRGEVSPAVDVFAAAVVLFEMLQGATPWTREQVLAGAREHRDFMLPADVFGEIPAVAEAFREHVMLLGHPDANLRPSAEDALKQAQQLRAQIIVATADAR
ncbi:MAG TPA: protein kinase [Kofleriaceae bacterium]|nr:protein kinase [Kofleriaceae bacterium]